MGDRVGRFLLGRPLLPLRSLRLQRDVKLRRDVTRIVLSSSIASNPAHLGVALAQDLEPRPHQACACLRRDLRRLALAHRSSSSSARRGLRVSAFRRSTVAIAASRRLIRSSRSISAGEGTVPLSTSER